MVTIRVPRDASPGERYAVIWAQESSRGQNSQHFAILEVNRVGVRIYLDVGPGGPPPTRFVITSVTGGRSPSGLPEVIAHVRDTGARAIDLFGVLRLADGPGGSVGRAVPVPVGADPRSWPVRHDAGGPQQDHPRGPAGT